jgi:hypothetical protein
VPFIIAALFGGGVALLRGGRLSNLSGLSLRRSGLPIVALGLQILALYGPGREDARPFGVPAILILASYGLLLVTVLANRQLPGIAWLGLGAALNLLVILANSGWMPVTAKSLAVAGFIESPSAVVSGQRMLGSKDMIQVGHEINLRWLSDRFIVPQAGLLTAVFSLGDILMMFGLFLLIQAGVVDRENS